MFADPEIAAVGLTTDEARQQGIDVAAAEVALPTCWPAPRTYDTKPAGRPGMIADRQQSILIGPGLPPRELAASLVPPHSSVGWLSGLA